MRRLAPLVLTCAACGGDEAPASADALPDAGPGPADDIGFSAKESLTSGSWLLANDWATDPNVVFVLPIADLAASRRELFSVNRAWSMNSAADGSTIWFSASDPAQQEHFGITIGDAIQNTFAFDPATRGVRSLAPGGWTNVNDECHSPSRDGQSLYVCRRYDFEQDGRFLGWRVGRFSLADGSFEFLRPDSPGGPFELAPQERSANQLVLELRNRPPAVGGSIHVRDLTTGTERLVLADSTRPLLAPDGRQMLFRDGATRTYKIFDFASPSAPPVEVSPTLDPGSAAWSPDGTTIVYTVFDSANSCDHLEQVTFTTTWSPPIRVRDCATTGEFITDIAWIVAP